MAFFVLDKDVTTGVLRLPVNGTFATREEALGALSAAIAAGTATVEGQVFVADLESAVPVLVMPTAPASAVDSAANTVTAESEPGAVEPGLEPGPESEPGVIEPAAAVLEVVEPADGAGTTPVGAPGGDTLAEALKRAATSLEGEGIVAPESISAGDFSFEDEVIEEPRVGEGGSDTEPASTEHAAFAAVAGSMATEDERPREVLEAPVDWPWANVVAFTETDEPEPEEAASDGVEPDGSAVEPVALDEPDTLITSAPPMGEDAYLPRPVILGDYTDAPEPASGEAPGSDATGSSAEDDVEPVVEAAPEMAYEPTGELDLSAYTCNDCVYSNTCPKVGEVTPADCGTFQWRSS